MLLRLNFSVLILALFAASALRAGETNRFNLSEKPTAPRFKVTEKKWPEKVGEADLCLWHDDKLAALSLGVDDNFAGEIDWWKEQAKLYDFKVTWFVITGRIMKEEEGRSYGGYWSQFKELESLGHAVESHTVTHLHVAEPGWGTPEWNYAKAAAARGASIKAAREAAILAGAVKLKDGAPAVPEKPAATEESGDGAPTAAPSAESLAAARLAAADKPATDPARGIAWEYLHSIEQIDGNIPGKKASALAYPGGRNTVYNDRNIAAKYFRVVRGARGAPNDASMTDYMATNAMSGWDFESTQGGNPRNVIDPERYRGRYYRGWVILFAHGVSASHEFFTKTFEFLKENREKLWIGLFTDVAKYGQERDTATLKVVSPGPDKITFLLTDEMDDSYFNYPLTVKVRIPNEWKEVGATQGDKDVTAKIIEHEGASYALVPTVPDAGLVTIVKK
jgi:hypothetical protein